MCRSRELWTLKNISKKIKKFLGKVCGAALSKPKKSGVFVDYFPHGGQLPFHEDRYKVRNRGLIGGGSSGKTEAGVFETIGWCVDNPGCIGGIFAPTFKMIKRNIIPKFEKLLGVSDLESSPFVRRFQKTDMMLEFNTFTKNHRGRPSKVWLVGLERPEAAEGMNLDFAYLDEARLVPRLEQARQSIMRRLRGSGMALPFDRKLVPEKAVGLWMTTTPDMIGSDLYHFFEHPKKRNPESQVYRMSLYDNKENLPPGFVDEMVRTHGGAFAFDISVHVQQFVKPEIRQIVFGCDWGWTNPSAMLAVALDGDGRAFFVDEIYGSRMSEQMIISECLALQAKWGHGTFWCDPSRPDMIAALSREGLDARGNKSKRDDGVAEIGGRLHDAGDGRRRLYVSPECVNLIEELQIYNPDKKEYDHCVDAARYALMGGKRGGGGPVAARGQRRR